MKKLTTLLLLAASTITFAGNNAAGVRLKTNLSGSAIAGITPNGHVEYRQDDKNRNRFTVEVENVNLPVGTVLTVHVLQGTTEVAISPSQITLVADLDERGNRGGELELEAEHGATVPDLSKGTFTIQVNNGATTILTGALHK